MIAITEHLITDFDRNIPGNQEHFYQNVQTVLEAPDLVQARSDPDFSVDEYFRALRGYSDLVSDMANVILGIGDDFSDLVEHELVINSIKNGVRAGYFWAQSEVESDRIENEVVQL